jgi:anti-sigma factor RsiW
MSELVCSNGVDQLMDYLEDVVPPAVRVALDEHVAGCPKCVAFIASYLATPRIVREATRAEAPASLGPLLLQFLRQHRED